MNKSFLLSVISIVMFCSGVLLIVEENHSREQPIEYVALVSINGHVIDTLSGRFHYSIYACWEWKDSTAIRTSCGYPSRISEEFNTKDAADSVLKLALAAKSCGKYGNEQKMYPILKSAPDNVGSSLELGWLSIIVSLFALIYALWLLFSKKKYSP